MTSTYKALGGVIHQAELETLLIFKSFGQGVSQAVGGQHALPALLELAEYTLEKHNKQRKTHKRTGLKLNLVVKPNVGENLHSNNPLVPTICT